MKNDDNDRMLKVAIDEARSGLDEGGIPIGAALFQRDGRLLGRGHNGAFRRTIHRSTAKQMRFARRDARPTIAIP